METHQIRVCNERDELAYRLDRLCSFVNTSTFDGLSRNERDLLHRQRAVMQQYLSLLNERIGLWTTNIARLKDTGN